MTDKPEDELIIYKYAADSTGHYETLEGRPTMPGSSFGWFVKLDGTKEQACVCDPPPRF